MNIRKKPIIIMVLVSFVPLVLLSAILNRYLSASLEEEKIVQYREVAAEVKLQIDGVLDRAITTMKVVANHPSVPAFVVAQTRPS